MRFAYIHFHVSKFKFHSFILSCCVCGWMGVFFFLPSSQFSFYILAFLASSLHPFLLGLSLCNVAFSPFLFCFYIFTKLFVQLHWLALLSSFFCPFRMICNCAFRILFKRTPTYCKSFHSLGSLVFEPYLKSL